MAKVNDFIEIINVNNQKTKKMLRETFLKMPIDKDQTRNGWVEKGKDNIADLSRLVPPELQATNKSAVYKMASDIEDQVRKDVESSVKEQMETLTTDNENLRKVNETLNTQITELRGKGTDNDKEVEKLADYLLKNYPDDVKDGSAVDSAIALIARLASSIRPAQDADEKVNSRKSNNNSKNQ